jgi:hypothetical protein
MSNGPILPDAARGIYLGDGYAAAWCVDADGQSWPWFFTEDVPESDVGCGCPHCAPHEGAGRLPKRFRRAIGCVCGQPRRDGEPCRNLVPHPGDVCDAHQEIDSNCN